MIEVQPNLWVGNGDDEATVRGNPDWFVVSGAKEPFHRKTVGYTTRALPSDHPEYLFAHRPGQLVLNLIDADDPKYIRHEIMEVAVAVIDQALLEDRKVLVHCNQGRSRSPSIVLWYMHKRTDALPQGYDEAMAAFAKLYPDYAPAEGMAGFLRVNW